MLYTKTTWISVFEIPSDNLSFPSMIHETGLVNHKTIEWKKKKNINRVVIDMVVLNAH